MLYIENREVDKNIVLCSIWKLKDARKGVGYLWLGILAGCQPHTSFTEEKLNRNSNDNKKKHYCCCLVYVRHAKAGEEGW